MQNFQDIEHFVKTLSAAIKKKIPTKVSQLTNDAGYKTTDTNTTYKLSKSGSTVTLTGSDGSTTSVTDSNTTYSSLKNPYSLDIQNNGTTVASYDGSTAKTANFTNATTSANGLMSAADKKAVDREFFRMLPKGGTVIPNGANLNSTAYLKVGNYYQSADVNTTNMTNIPFKSAFIMYVLSPLSEVYDNEETSRWVYRLRIFVEYNGNIFVQKASSGSTVGSFSYGPWVKMTNSNDLGAVSNTINTHIANKSNPHGVTKAQVGLGNVDNTADSAKSVKYAASAGSANSVAWGNVSDKPSTYPPSSHTHDDRYYTESEINSKLNSYVTTSDSRLTNARPASDVYAWAKAASKPSYSASEIGAAPASHNHDDRYEIAYRSNFASNGEYIRLGIATMRQQGDYLFIRVYSGNGYNGQITQDRAFDIHLRTSNGSGPLYAGYVEYHLNGSSNNDVYIVPNSSGTTYAIWIGLTSYSGNGFYIVEESNGAGWSNSQTTSNSIPSGAIKLTQKNIAYTSDIPTSLPANGGNSSTVNGHTVNADIPSGAKFTDTTYSAATQSANGLMSAADKKKLDGVAAGADVSPIKTVKVNGTALTPDSNKAVNVTVPTLANNATTTTSGMALDARMGKTLSDQIASVKVGAIDQIVNLTAAGWTGDTAPYSQTVNVTGMTEDLLCELFSACPKSATVAEREAYNEAFALVASGYAETADGSATFLVDEKPTIDIGVRIYSLNRRLAK